MNLLASISLYAGGQGSGCQGPNCGRPKVVMYHGTSRSLLDKIKNRGIVPQKTTYHTGPSQKLGRTYLTTDPKVARDYAYGRKASGGGAVLKVQVPREVFDRMEKDKDEKKSFSYKGSIPAEWITVHSVEPSMKDDIKTGIVSTMKRLGYSEKEIQQYVRKRFGK